MPADRAGSAYLMAGQTSELDRLRLQSLVWEPAARNLLTDLAPFRGRRAVDLGCGCLGWLRVLSEWVGPDGEVIGTDVDDRLLGMAQQFVQAEGLRNVTIVHDDLFASQLEPESFDLVHARFQIAPLGRAAAIVDAMRRLVAWGGRVVLEDPDSASWHYNPPAPALETLIGLILDAFRASGGDFDAGRTEPALLRALGLSVTIRAEAFALDAGHPYLALPLQFAAALEARLLTLVDAAELDRLRAAAADELSDAQYWGTTFTLIQTVGSRPER